jgi:uncharacterized SAM-binding protein YcdF (DUF218 family)
MRTPSRRVLVVALVALSLGSLGCFRLGVFLAPEDPLTKADAIFVFAGSRASRPLEAIDLYKQGYAPLIVLTRDQEEPALAVLAERGVTLPTRFSMARDILRQLDVPDAAIVAPDRVHDNTAQEASTLAALAASRSWRRVILVSSKYHMRRAGLAARRALRGTGVEIVRRSSRYDPATPDRWWQRRSDLREMLWELPKLIGYAVGVGE